MGQHLKARVKWGIIAFDVPNPHLNFSYKLYVGVSITKLKIALVGAG